MKKVHEPVRVAITLISVIIAWAGPLILTYVNDSKIVSHNLLFTILWPAITGFLLGGICTSFSDYRLPIRQGKKITWAWGLFAGFAIVGYIITFWLRSEYR